MKVEEIELVRTCFACPEQYDAMHNGKQVGYLRLRHGWFYVSVPDCCDEIIYETAPEGDGLFEDDEREKYLNEAKEAIVKYYTDNPLPTNKQLGG